MEKLKLAVSVSSGMETVLKREIEKAGFGSRAAINGKVLLDGTVEDILRLNMSLRTAERVFLVVAEGRVNSFDELYEIVYRVDWKRFIDVKGKVVVGGKCVKSQLSAVSACQKIVKKAIVDKLMKQYSVNSVSETGLRYDIGFSIHNDELVLTLDTSGDALHKRGYRDLSVPAPLKETIAAGMIMLSDWSFKSPLVDLCCGSGTIPIEAALYAKNKAPNLNRAFACEKWRGFVEQGDRERLIEELKSKEFVKTDYDILGRDIDPNCVSISERHARRAGVGNIVKFECGDLTSYSRRDEGGTIISNLPYGERLLTAKELTELHRGLRKAFNACPNWSGYFLTAAAIFEKEFGKRCDKERKVYNGDIECRIFMYLKRSKR